METNYLFIAILILFLYLVIRGYRRGFLRIVVTFIGMIIIIAAVKRATPYVSEYLISNTKVYEAVQEKVTEKFKEANLRYDNTIEENQIKTINSYEIPDSLKKNLILNNTQLMYKKLLVDVFEEYVSAYLAKSAVKAMAFVVLFITFGVLFRLLLRFVDIISKIPIIKGINKLAGGCLGFVEALIITWVFFFLVVMFIGSNSGSMLLHMIADNEILSFLFNSNILMNVIA